MLPLPTTPRIGLTGGIGSGKSTVASMLVERGAALIDTDAIARELTLAGGAAIEPLRAAFGAGFIAADGSLDRARMRAAAFADVAIRQQLEAILHPRIGDEVERLAAVSQGALLILDIPLLVESGRWRSHVDRVWLIDCSEATQMERVTTRPGWTAQAVAAVIAQQASRAARRAAADAVVHNEGITSAELKREVDALWEIAANLRR